MGVVLVFVLMLLVMAGMCGTCWHKWYAQHYCKAVGEKQERTTGDGAARRAPRVLSSDDRDGFCHVWESVRVRFAEDPQTAVTYADLLLNDLLLHYDARWCADAQHEEYAATYRVMHGLLAQRSRPADRDVLKRAMDAYAAVFDNLLGAGTRTPPPEYGKAHEHEEHEHHSGRDAPAPPRT